MGMYRIGALIAALCLLAAAMAMAEPPAAETEPGAGEAIEATEEAACEAMQDLGVCAHSKGIVYYYNDCGPEVWATLGSREGLRRTARVAFLRKGEVVAEGTVVQVKESDCVVRPDKETPGGAIMLGDQMEVVRNGTFAAAEAQRTREHREKVVLNWLVFAGMVYLVSL